MIGNTIAKLVARPLLALLMIVALSISVILPVGCSSGEAVYIRTESIDAATQALTVMEYEHHAIHEGDMFTVLEVTDLGNMAVRDILVVTPNTTRWAHLVWEIEHELETGIQFYRGTTYAAAGTIVPSFNRNGNSATAATTVVTHTPNVTLVGTLVGTIQQGNGKKAGGSDRESNEFILEQNQAYLIRISNLTVNDNLIFMKLNWYEHENIE